MTNASKMSVLNPGAMTEKIVRERAGVTLVDSEVRILNSEDGFGTVAYVMIEAPIPTASAGPGSAPCPTSSRLRPLLHSAIRSREAGRKTAL